MPFPFLNTMNTRSCPLPLRRLPLLLALTLSSPLALAQSAETTVIGKGSTLDASSNPTRDEAASASNALSTTQAGETRAAPAAHAEEAALDAVHVKAIRSEGFKPVTVKAGTFRGASVMDVPSTINVVTEEVLEKQGADGLYDAVRNTAGVTRQQNGGNTWDQLVIRGIPVENRTNYRLNGSMPILNFGQIALENKERVEVLKGASALYYGFSAPSGIVNYVTKRAGRDPVNAVGLKIDSNGSAIAHGDWGRIFGEQDEFGLRLNAAGGLAGTYLDGAGDGNRSFVSAAFDWRATDRLVISLDAEYDRRRTVEQVGVALPPVVNGAIALPRTVDPARLVGPDWAVFRTESTNVQLRADYALDDNWALTLEAGRSEVERDRTLPIFRFTNGAAAVASGAGRIQGNIQQAHNVTNLVRAEATGIVNTGPLVHNLTLGVARADKSADPIHQRNYNATQNLYNPVPLTSVTIAARPANPTTEALDTVDTGTYAIDRIEISPQWQAIAGLRYSKYRLDQDTEHYRASKTTPMAALIYKPTDELSVYGSYSKALEEGETAPNGTVNEGTRMRPGVSDQMELGTRMELDNGTLLSAAVFSIERPGYYTNAANVFTADGKQQYRGLEVSAQGKFTRQLSWMTALALLDPQFKDTTAQYDGKLPENAAKRTASLFLSYDLAALPGLSVNGGAFYTGRRPVNDLNQAWLGGVTLYSLGAQYRSALLGKNTTLQFNVDNVADKQYCAGAGTRLSAGAPRTFKAGIRVDF